jgi:uncharacterized protein (TIGR02301 family)
MKWIFTLLLLSLSTNAFAQSEPTAKELEKAAELAEERIDDNMVTMSNLMEALSNHLGQLHYLRTLCYSLDDQKWRSMASAMMDVETPGDGSRRRELIRAFNDGFYMQKARYQTCSSKVAIDVAALAENGRRLSVMLGDPYRERGQ